MYFPESISTLSKLEVSLPWSSPWWEVPRPHSSRTGSREPPQPARPHYQSPCWPRWWSEQQWYCHQVPGDLNSSDTVIKSTSHTVEYFIHGLALRTIKLVQPIIYTCKFWGWGEFIKGVDTLRWSDSSDREWWRAPDRRKVEGTLRWRLVQEVPAHPRTEPSRNWEEEVLPLCLRWCQSTTRCVLPAAS